MVTGPRCGSPNKKNWRWVYGTQIEQWVLVPPSDRDWKLWGIPQDEFKKMTKSEAMAAQRGGRVIRGRK